MTFTSEEKRRAIASASVTNIKAENLFMGDNYSAGQAGAMGPNSQAHRNSFEQVWNKNNESIDLTALVPELSQLRTAMRSAASEEEHDVALGYIATAEKAAKSGDGPAVLQNLKHAGKWAFDVATKIGVSIASDAIKKSMGFDD